MSEKISRRNFLRTATLGAAAAGLLAGCGSASSSTAAGTYTAGTYSATATGINTTTPVTVTMTFNADTIPMCRSMWQTKPRVTVPISPMRW